VAFENTPGFDDELGAVPAAAAPKQKVHVRWRMIVRPDDGVQPVRAPDLGHVAEAGARWAGRPRPARA